MLRTIRTRLESEKGFTLIELLVVILIIGILAAIALPAFLNQQEKGQDAEAKSAARTAATALETYATDNEGNYTGADLLELREIEPSLSNAELSEPDATDETYSIIATSESGGTFTIERAGTGIITRECSDDSGGCNDGVW